MRQYAMDMRRCLHNGERSVMMNPNAARKWFLFAGEYLARAKLIRDRFLKGEFADEQTLTFVNPYKDWTRPGSEAHEN